MHFDFCIGNPPYQDSIDTYNRQEPVYPYFYDAAEQVAFKSLLISPARFLFNAGLTSKDWNKKMLADKHLKVENYFQNASEVFLNTDIKGGVAVIYRDKNKNFGPVVEFIPDNMLRIIASHFTKNMDVNLPSIMFGGRSDLKFNDVFLKDFPQSVLLRLDAVKRKHPDVTQLAPNEEYELKSSTLETLSSILLDSEPHDKHKYYKILGLINSKRVFRWIERKYMYPRYPENNNIQKYKVLFSEANNSGVFGETLSQLVILGPMESATPTFISVGNFSTEIEAENLMKYIKTKLVRALLGILKKTQHTAPPNWAYVPLQDFTDKSDINWSKSVHEIDLQLYRKYGLDKKEIAFIEEKVKAMD